MRAIDGTAVARLFVAAVACAAMVAGATFVGCARGSRAGDAPNVVLISIDSLRADHVGAYGYARKTTPAIDALARRGVVFERAYSSTSWTLPAHAALLTGLPDSAHGVLTPKDRLGAEAETLAEAFSAAGYATAGFYSGPFLHPEFGLAQGFEEYIDCSSYGLGTRRGKEIKAHGASHKDITNPQILWNVLYRLDQRDRRPFFYFIHMWDVHYDLIPPAPFDTMFDEGYRGSYEGHDFRHDPAFRSGMDEADRAHVLALYDGEIRYTDETIRQILARMQALGLADDTIVVITSDHGEEFLEHGGKGHRQSLFEEVTRIPLVLVAPGALEPARVPHPVGLIDVAPTLLELAGLPPLEGALGGSLLAMARGAQPPTPRAVLSELVAPPRAPDLKALVMGTDKLIVDRKRNEETYYDLASDPHERSPRDATSEPRAAVLRKALAAIEQRAMARALPASPAAAGDAAVPKAVTEELRALGYLD